MQEVARLEGARKDLMLGIIDSKRQQLAAVCALSHMSMPPLPEAHPAESGEVRASRCVIRGRQCFQPWKQLAKGQ